MFVSQAAGDRQATGPAAAKCGPGRGATVKPSGRASITLLLHDRKCALPSYLWTAHDWPRHLSHRLGGGRGGLAVRCKNGISPPQ